MRLLEIASLTLVLTLSIPAGGWASAHQAVQISANALAAPDAPLGFLDGVSPTADGRIQVTGWAAAPSYPGSAVEVHVYVTGPKGTNGTPGIYTSEERNDVARVHPWAGTRQGFSASVPHSGLGSNVVCVYAIDIGPAQTNPNIGCKSINVQIASMPKPLGSVDSAVGNGGMAVVSGWAFDPNRPHVSIPVHIYVTNGTTTSGYPFEAINPRPDVNRVYAITGNHGFSATVALLEGRNRICAYGIGMNGNNALIGQCLDVNYSRTGTAPGTLPGWGAPVWRDEFDGGLEKWNVRTQATFGLGIDAGIPEAANNTVAGGLLHIKGQWLPDAPRPRPASATGVTILTHTTGYLDQRALRAGDKTYSQTYGRWEIRTKTPTGPNTRGSLAAFWLRPNDRPGEIDIMEAWGYGGVMAADHTKYLQGTAVTTIHTKTDGSGTKKFWRHKEHGGPAEVWRDFHTYAFEYTPTYAATFVDGVQIMRVTPASDGGTFLWDQRYFGSPMHVRLNMHIGPSSAYWGLPQADQRQLTGALDFQVDYVRIYPYKP